MRNINSLPVELLSEIFKHSVVAIMQITFTTYLPAFSLKDASVNLIHVCRRWRKIAFSISSLWASHAWPQVLSMSSVDAMEYWLQFSRRVPLKLGIPVQAHSEKLAFSRLSAKMLQVYAKHLDRWQFLSVNADDILARNITDVLRSAEAPCPLESFEVHFGLRVDPSTASDLASSLCRLKTLRRLEWMRCPGDVIDGLPWKQLQVVLFQAASTPEQFLSHLSRCESATTVTLSGYADRFPTLSTFDHPHTTLSHLTSLTLDHHADPLNLLRYFTLPSLRHLQINVLECRSGFNYLGEFLSRSACPLEVLTVEDRECSSEHVISFFSYPFLRLIPTVKFVVWYARKLMIKIAESRDHAMTSFPTLVVWEDPPWPEIIGWTTGAAERVLFYYKDGQLTSTRPE